MQNTIVGGEDAIGAAHELLSLRRRGDPAVAELTLEQIEQQLGLAVDRVICEGGLYDRELAALAIRQAQGDLVEAIALLRTARTALRRFGRSEPVEPDAMLVRRRVATTHRTPPGGQFLGATYDYTHRLLAADAPMPDVAGESADSEAPTLGDPLHDIASEGLLIIEQAATDDPPADLTRGRLDHPARRDLKLQALARADEGFLSSLVYSALADLGGNHPLLSDLRAGDVEVQFMVPELGLVIGLADVTVTECQTVHETAAHDTRPPAFTSGYGLVLGQAERKAIAMAMIDRLLRADEFGEPRTLPAQDERFVLAHADAVAAAGQVDHLKLPHYVDFEAQLQTMRQMRAEHARRQMETSDVR